jgi:hypothetical protein
VNERLHEVLQYRTILAFPSQSSAGYQSCVLSRRTAAHTTVIGIVGAFGNMNLTSSNFDLRRQFSARETHPAPLSPNPCAMMTVAVCFVTAGMVRAVGGRMVAIRSVYVLGMRGRRAGSRVTVGTRKIKVMRELK